jgi:hypothetical protein
MNKRRLLKLADLLEADANDKNGVKFDIRAVIEHKGITKNSKTVPVSCGTAACAMGLAAISGAFKRAGLSYEITEDCWDTRQDAISIEITMGGEQMCYDEAAMELFDIRRDEAYFLFSPDGYSNRTPKTGAKGERYVAQRIRDFVSGKVAA